MCLDYVKKNWQPDYSCLVMASGLKRLPAADAGAVVRWSNCVITKPKFLGMDDDNEEHEDPQARLDAEFVLLTGTMRRMRRDLGKFLGE